MLLLNTIEKDPTRSTEEALAVVYQLIRSSEPPNLETAQKFIERIFFSPKKYDLGQVGRYRLNQQFNLDVPVEETVLTMDDIIQVVNFLIDMRKGDRGIDDIDHLGNRRVKTIGEQLTNQFSVALSRMIRTIHERMNLRESESITPQDLINSRVVTTVINTFFGTSQLSQFGDQTNPLAEITHKRRISALGPGGLTRRERGLKFEMYTILIMADYALLKHLRVQILDLSHHWQCMPRLTITASSNHRTEKLRKMELGQLLLIKLNISQQMMKTVCLWPKRPLKWIIKA